MKEGWTLMADCFLEELGTTMNNMKLSSTVIMIRLWGMRLSLGASRDLDEGNSACETV